MRNLLLLVVLLFAACSSAPPASHSPGATDNPASPGQPTDPPASPGPAEPTPSPAPPTSAPSAGADEWRVLADELSLPEHPFAVRAAVTRAELEALWLALGQDAQPVPSVDFSRELVLYLGTSGSSSCPDVLEGLVVDHQNARVHGQWRMQQPRACTDDLAPQGVLIAVQRASLPDQPFLFSLRRDPVCRDCPGQPEQVMVDPTVAG